MKDERGQTHSSQTGRRKRQPRQTNESSRAKGERKEQGNQRQYS